MAKPKLVLGGEDDPRRRRRLLFFALPLVFIVISVGWQSFQRNDPRINRTHALYQACVAYAQKNGGNTPDALADLVPDYFHAGDVENSLFLTDRYVLLTPGQPLEPLRADKKPLLLERPNPADTHAKEVLMMRADGSLERADPRSEGLRTIYQRAR
jgi:hypothetical protein